MKTILTSERDGVKGYIPPPNRDKRRELKGYFMVNFATEGDLYKKNREILDKANPVLVQARRRFEQFDLKNLMKRREQRVLKNSIATTR